MDETSEIEELRARIAQVELERDQAVARTARRSAQLAQLEENQRTMHEHLYILKTKYDTMKAENHNLLWNHLPANCLEFRDVSEAGGCHVVESETHQFVDDIQLEDHVTGEGRFGEVRLGVTWTGATVAVKRISKAKVRSIVALRNLANEVSAMRALSGVDAAGARVPAADGGGDATGDHAAGAADDGARARLEHVARLHDVRISNGFVYIIQEAGGCDLYRLIGEVARNCPLSPLIIAAVARGLSAAVAAVHAHGWCHRDIKPENVLLGGDVRSLSALAEHEPELAAARVHVRLCDFGITTRLPRDGEPRLTQFCGTPGFFAPELVADAAEDAREDAEDKPGRDHRLSASDDVRPRAGAPPSPRSRHLRSSGDQRSPPIDPRAAPVAPAGEARSARAPRARGYDGRAADVFSFGATLLETLLGRVSCARLWMSAYSGFDRQGRAQLRSGVRNARAAVLAHAGLLYDEQATAESVAAPVASHATGAEAAAELPMAITQPRAAEPEGAGAREAARQRALARDITELVLSCLETSVTLRVSSAALAERAASLAAAPELGGRVRGPARGGGRDALPAFALTPQLGAMLGQGAMPPLETSAGRREQRDAYADDSALWARDGPPLPFTVSPEAVGYEGLTERGQERQPSGALPDV